MLKIKHVLKDDTSGYFVWSLDNREHEIVKAPFFDGVRSCDGWLTVKEIEFNPEIGLFYITKFDGSVDIINTRSRKDTDFSYVPLVNPVPKGMVLIPRNCLTVECREATDEN